jgi:hypothetical protein
MTAEEETQPVTTEQILSTKGISFVADGKTFYVRPPTTEEYDDAFMMQRIVKRRLQAMPEFKEMQGMPGSDESRAALAAVIESTEDEFALCEPGREKDALAEKLATYRRTLEKRSLADELIDDRASLERDRYLSMHLLTDEDGVQLVNTTKPNCKQRWDRGVPMSIKNAIRPLIWVMLRMVDEAPFDWDLLHVPK